MKYFLLYPFLFWYHPSNPVVNMKGDSFFAVSRYRFHKMFPAVRTEIGNSLQHDIVYENEFTDALASFILNTDGFLNFF